MAAPWSKEMKVANNYNRALTGKTATGTVRNLTVILDRGSLGPRPFASSPETLRSRTPGSVEGQPGEITQVPFIPGRHLVASMKHPRAPKQ